MKLTLLCFGIETSFVKAFEYFFDILVICRHVVRVDKCIIKIDHNTDIQKIREYIVHKLLEGCRDISKTR